MFSLDEYKDAMLKVEPPTGIDAVQAVRARYLDSREAVQQAEEALRLAQGSRGANLEPLYLRLQQARDTALQAKEEFERIGRFAGPLEANALADARKREQEASARKLEAEQVAANELEKAAFKQEIRATYLAAGYTPEEFERRFNESGGLWDMRVAERVARREREQGQAWRDRYATFHL